ncbi:MAG: hypothetical protein KatS3mg031_0924 [Chitinophagales bacterium]|nr:MAG: hypothetical protein KatS3mg031_0924 [Chitinophagales bacterium]
MNKLPAVLSLTCLLVGAVWGYELTATEEPDKAATLANQFDDIMEKSNRYQDYKVVKIVWLENLKKQVTDSLAALHKQIRDNQQNIVDLKNQLQALQASLAASRDSLAKTSQERDSITFIKAQMPKSSYKRMMWGIVAALFLLLAFFIYRFKQSNRITVETLQTLKETKAEFEAFRKRAREREQLLKRELQDEINKRA